IELFELRERRLRDHDFGIAEPSEITVVADHDTSVSGETHVQLDLADPHLRCQCERSHGVLGGVGGGASMCDDSEALGRLHRYRPTTDPGSAAWIRQSRNSR